MNLGILILLISDLFFAMMPLFVKKAMNSSVSALSASQVAFLRFLIGLLVIFFRLLLGHRLQFHNFKVLFRRGILGGASILFYFLSIQGISPGVATLLNYSWPIFAVVLSAWFLKEPFSGYSIVALLFTCLGIVGVTLGSSGDCFRQHSGMGAIFYIGCGVASAILSGAAILTIRSARQSEGYWELFFFLCLVGALMSGGPAVYTWKWPEQEQWIYLVGVGLSSVVAQVGMTYALKEVHATLSSFLMLLIPVLTLVGGILFFKEHLTWISAGGSVITLLGVGYGMYLEKKSGSQKIKT